MLRRLLGTSLGLLFSVAVAAQDGGLYECTMGSLLRRVEIFYEPGRVVPCEVRYIKETEAPGETQVLWNAQTESGYCEARTSEFIARLESLGWQCQATAGGSEDRDAEGEQAAEDDTDVLSAPE